MAVLDTLGTPPGVCVPGDVFDFVEGGLDERFEVGAGLKMLAFEAVTGVDGEDGLDVEIFGPFEEFEQTEAVGGPVGPGAW